ncbi:hypothetical protein [Thermococcus waiotapuensis]|uniref:Uncharacterized protein n=1 Tax=Thermococcus waiotapuensis TaxID=90909 RepID=A0AAE4NUX0_9EURY|nr:hypothetical protein [Thermococcus waiotapuensis]MDV3103278.1 hypothetical protein [Thermococcus waiotapuensis]
MRWSKTLALIFLLSLLSSALVASVGISYWSSLRPDMHAEIRLDNAESLLKFGNAVNKNVTYDFDLFWPMKPGLTSLSLHIEGIACNNENYKITVVTMNGRQLEGSGRVEFDIERKDPFLYFHVHLNLPSSCTVLPGKNDPVVVIDAKVK